MKNLFLYLLTCVSSIGGMQAQAKTWANTTIGSAWLTASNWSTSGAPSGTEIAQFGNVGTAASLGINMNGSTNNGTNNQQVAAIQVLSSRTINTNIGNSSTTAAGIFTINGTTINTVPNVVISNESSGNVSIQRNTGSGTSAMTLSLPATNNTFNISNNGDINIKLPITGAINITKIGTGAGVLNLDTVNTFTGLLTIEGGTVRLRSVTAGATLPATNNVTINGGRLAVNENQTLNNITLASGAELFIATGKTLTITGTLTVAGGASVLGAGTIVYSGAGKLVYTNGTAAQTTSIEWPATNAAEVEINNTNGVTLNKSTIQNGALTLSNGKLTLGAFNLTIGASGSITGASSTNYIATTDVAGNLIREDIGSTAVAFPIGTATNYHPVTIANNGTDAGVEDFGVNVMQQAPGYGDPTENVDLLFNISEGTAGGANCDITMQFSGAASQGGAFSTLGAKIAHVNAGVVDYVNGTSNGSVVSGTGFSNFSPFFITSDAEILPVAITSFSATEAAGKVNVNWAVSHEQNIKSYIIERSANGVDFNTLQSANATRANSYTIADITPMKGANYYRLKIVEQDGSFNYSRTIRVDVANVKAGIKVFPTVSASTINITSNTAAVKNYYIVNAMGSVVHSGKMNVATTIDISTLQAGVYQVKVDNQVFAIIKN